MRKRGAKIKPDSHLINSKSVFTITLIVIALTILSIWLFGLGEHRTLYVNSILSTSILSLAFFLFISIGLYKGLKLKDDLGKITNHIKPSKFPNLSEAFSSDIPTEIGEGCEGILLSILFWILVTILFSIFIWLFGTLLWAGILLFIAMLYWIFFRALRLVFKQSNTCKNKIGKSMAYGIAFTTLYNFWIYGIILISHYFIK